MKRLLRDRRGLFGALVLTAAIVFAIAAPLVTHGDPNAQHEIVATRFIAPLSTDGTGVFHVLGTDRFGRDVWTRLVYGARVSLGVGLLAVLISIALGVTVGALAGYGRGPVPLILLGLTDFALAVPRIVLLLLLAALWRPSTALVIVVLGLTGWMSVARLVHGEVRALAARPFVEGVGRPPPACAGPSHPPERRHARHRRRGARRRQRDHAGSEPLIPGTGGAAADGVVGKHDRVGPGRARQRAVGRHGAGRRARDCRGRVYAAGGCGARRYGAVSATFLRTAASISWPPSKRTNS